MLNAAEMRKSLKRILVVDDEPSFASLLKERLEATGQYLLRVEQWAEDALDAAREFRPQLILLDIIMPRMPGGNVAAQLKANPETRKIPIVFLTGAVRRAQIEENEGIICDLPCIPKTATLEELITVIEKHALKPEQ